MSTSASPYIRVILLAFFTSITDGRGKHSVVIIVGGTGDLAAKYLWQSVFSVYLAKMEKTPQDFSEAHDRVTNHTFEFYAAGRSQSDVGNVALNKILTSRVDCDLITEVSSNMCQQRLAEFIDKVTYVSLQSEEDFTMLCSLLTNKFAIPPVSSVKEFILYMAVPPAAYEIVLHNFQKQCTSLRSLNISVRLALEKPFGLDRISAEIMSRNLLSIFREDEIYRVDHYLEKSVAKAILPFRKLNPNIENILNKDFVERVDIFIKETTDVADRLEVYNSMGVLRDIHQNHLTQLLVLVAMDLPANVSNTLDVHNHKEVLLRQVESVGRLNTVFGQYKQFASNGEQHGINDTGDTPTFAASVVKINSPRWQTVPFLLVSGKQLDVRESFVRIVFKNNNVCISNCGGKAKTEEGKQIKQVVFHIGHGNISRPSILVSGSFRELHCPDHFERFSDSKIAVAPVVYDDSLEHFLVCRVVKDTPAYESVIRDILSGKQENFVNTNQLILSWQVWDYIVNAVKNIRIYEQNDPHGRLNLILKVNHLEFISDEDLVKETVQRVVVHANTSPHLKQTPSSFLGHRLVTNQPNHLAFLLAKDIDRAANADIQNKGSFHIAFSGGSSLHALFQILAQSFGNLHWPSVHVWQVDERCVAHQDERSNFQVLDRELLRFVDIPYSNIHAMPVQVGGRLCDPELGGGHVYAESLRHNVPNAQLDFIVLGLGTDGHTASLFPRSTDLHVDSNTYVVTTEDGPPDSSKRMTMTLPLINRAKRVAIFVTGLHKQGIISKLESEVRQSVDTFPILGVNPVNGTVSWYIDYAAYHGS